MSVPAFDPARKSPLHRTHPGHAAEDALFSALNYMRTHGDERGFPGGALAHLHAIGEHVEQLLPWLRWGEDVRPWEN